MFDHNWEDEVTRAKGAGEKEKARGPKCTAGCKSVWLLGFLFGLCLIGNLETVKLNEGEEQRILRAQNTKLRLN